MELEQKVGVCALLGFGIRASVQDFQDASSNVRGWRPALRDAATAFSGCHILRLGNQVFNQVNPVSGCLTGAGVHWSSPCHWGLAFRDFLRTKELNNSVPASFQRRNIYRPSCPDAAAGLMVYHSLQLASVITGARDPVYTLSIRTSWVPWNSLLGALELS